ncbi:MAG TPA: murein L,D-transpeptidase, partial [Rhizobiaceae bacterium]
MKTSRRFFLSGAGALAMAAISGPVGAQDVISEILQSERRGNWDDTFDAR